MEDRGCGLTEEEREAVFEPFYRSPRARLLGRGGVGLGLSVVRRVVRASRGSIRVESVPGAGTSFTIRLPDTGSLDALAPRLRGAGFPVADASGWLETTDPFGNSIRLATAA